MKGFLILFENKLIQPRLRSHSGQCLKNPWNNGVPPWWYKLTKCNKICTHGKILYLSWEKYLKVLFHFVVTVQPYAAFKDWTLFSAFLGKVATLFFLTVLVTLVCIILLGSVTTVIASRLRQIGNEGFRILQEIYSFRCHRVIYSKPVSTTFFINKTAGGFSSIVAIEQLPNLKTHLDNTLYLSSL